MGQNYFFGCISFNLKVIWPNLVRSEILDLGTLDLETAVKPPQMVKNVKIIENCLNSLKCQNIQFF